MAALQTVLRLMFICFRVATAKLLQERIRLQLHQRLCSDCCSCAFVLQLQDFYRNFSNDPKVKIPWVRRDLSGPRVLTMEWIDGIRCTDPAAIRASGMDVAEFIRCGVVTGLRQLLEVSPVFTQTDRHP